jgi:glycosyltransferase involved in cell wall biosynthesis
MKLGFFSTEYFRKRPGMAESDRELCQEFARIGYDVRAVVEDRQLAPGDVTVGRDGAVRLWRYQAPKFHVLRPRTYADKVLKMMFGDPRVASLLGIYGRFMRENQDLDMLQVEAPFPEGALVGMVAKRARKPFIVSARGWESQALPWLRSRAIHWTLRRATGIRPNALNMEQLLVERFGADPRRVRVIRTNLSREAYLPPGSDLSAFRDTGREAVRRRTGLPHRFLVAAVARFVLSKGLEHLLAALRLLRDRDVPAGLVLCGDGILRGTLRARTIALGLTDDVAMVGSVPHTEIRALLAGVDLLVVPALLDWTPRAAVEAAVVGTPCVLTSAVGCAPWMLEAGAGRVVPPADPEALTDAIQGWLHDRPAWAVASRKATMWADTFAVERVAAEMNRFHREVVAAHQRTPGGA